MTRRPRETPLYRLVEDRFEPLLRVHEDELRPRHGRLRSGARRAGRGPGAAEEHEPGRR